MYKSYIAGLWILLTLFNSFANILAKRQDINHPPVFRDCETYQPTVKENRIHESLIHVMVTDGDDGPNGQVTINLLHNNANRQPYFGVKTTGPKTADLYSMVVFDREQPKPGGVALNGTVKYMVTLIASDNGTPSLSTTCFFFVTVEDENDNSPIFDESEYTTLFFINPKPEDRLIRVFAIDDDFGNNGLVSYRFKEEDSFIEGHFNLDPKSGWITKSKLGEVDWIGTITLTVIARDNGESPNESDPVVVTLTSTNDTQELPPFWQPIHGQQLDDITDVVVSEKLGRGSKTSLPLQAIVYDQEEAGILYNLIEGRTKQENRKRDFYFNYNRTHMWIKTLNIDYEKTSNYILHLRASAKSNRRLRRSRDARLRIAIEDVNDNVPQFVGTNRNGVYVAYVTADMAVEEFVAKVTAIDLDGTSPNNLVSYSWDEMGKCLDCNAFLIDEDTGVITTRQRFDADSPRYYTLTVVAEDGATSEFKSFEPNRAYVDVIVHVLH